MRAWGGSCLWCVWLLSAAGCGTRQVTIAIVAPRIAPTKSSVAWSEPFDTLSLKRWREVTIRGRTAYQATILGDRHCLQAQSQAGASILLSAVRIDPHTYPWLSWDWRVDELVKDEALDRKEGSDASARVYVYFETHGLPWQKRNLDYVWSVSLPIGTMINSPFQSTSKILVVESGSGALGQWRSVRRNLVDDYRRAFGTRPPRIIAIGLMSDTDSAGGQALAYFDELRIGRAAE